MSINHLDLLWKELSDSLYVASREGWDGTSPAWELTDPDVVAAWRRIASPSNRELLKAQLGTGGNPDGERMIEEAYRQSCQ